MRATRHSQCPLPSADRRDRGAAAVEMALVLPILLLVLFAMVDFGRAYNMKIELSQAAREGARVIALGGTGSEAQARAVLALGGSTGVTSTSTSCLPAGSQLNGSFTVNRTFTYLTPLGPIANTALGVTSSTLPGAGDSRLLRATGVMRCAG